MPVYPIEWTNATLFGSYPAMAKRDAELWEKYLRGAHPELRRVAYNVALGGVVPNVPDATDADLLGYQYSTACKVDALVDLGSEWWIVEVKPGATMGAVGQALGYVALALREGLTDLPLVPTILSDSVSPDLIYVCQEFDIQLLLIPDSPPGLGDFGPLPGPPVGGYETSGPPDLR